MAHGMHTLDAAFPIAKELVVVSADAGTRDWQKFCTRVQTTKEREQFGQITGFGFLYPGEEGSRVPEDSMRQLYRMDYRVTKYTLKWFHTDEGDYTDQYGLLMRATRESTKSADDTQNLHFARLFNQAFNASVTWSDGQPLCSTAHPTNGGPNIANMSSVALALSPTNLSIVKANIRRMPDARGRRMGKVGPFTLVHSYDLEPNVDVLLSTNLLPGTANNDVNVARKNVSSYAVKYMTHPTNWFLTDTDKEDLGFVAMFRMPRDLYKWYDGDVQKTFFRVREEYSFFPKHWWGVWGENA